MKLALLGIDPDVIELVCALAYQPQHQIVAVFDAAGHRAELGRLALSASWHDEWETLLHTDDVDAVIVARAKNADLREEQLRKLVQAAKPLLLVHPPCEAIVALELEMIREDTGGVLVPYFPERSHPLLLQMADLDRGGGEGPIGQVEQIVFERSMADRSSAEVLAQFSRDVECVRFLAGELASATATNGVAGEQNYERLNVQMNASRGAVARWSVGPAIDDQRATLTLVGSAGKVVLTMPRDPHEWRLDVNGEDLSSASTGRWRGPAAALDSLEAAIRGEAVSPSWLDACRDLDVVQAVQQSARRGRTIQLYDQKPSEEQTFKGVMAIGGCALLLLLIVVALVMSLATGLINPFSNFDAQQAMQRRDQPSSWPMLLRLWPVYPLALFLLLQFLRLIMKRKPTADPAAQDEANATASAK